MPVKYQCPKCGRRFAEWGAEKLGFKCPQDEACPAGAADESIELVRMGSSDERSSKKAPVRRLSRRSTAAAVAIPEDANFDEAAEFGPDDSPSTDDDVESEDDEDEEEEVGVKTGVATEVYEEASGDDDLEADGDSDDDEDDLESDGEAVIEDDSEDV